MGSSKPDLSDGFGELIERYEKWRRICSLAGKPIWDAPVWECDRLNLRAGYPYPDWTGYVVEPADDGYRVLTVTTERRIDPLETLAAYFTDIDDAGKYVILNIGEAVRLTLKLAPLQWKWDDAGLDPRVAQTSLDRYVSKYSLKSNPARYFVLQAGGIRPENRLLPMTYDELDELLTVGMPDAAISGD